MRKEKWFEKGLSSYFTTSLLTQSAGERAIRSLETGGNTWG